MGVRESLLTYTVGQRGCLLLVFKGYNFVRNRRSGMKTYWLCAKKGSTKCNARLVTDVIRDQEQIVLESCNHNHAQKVARKKRKSFTEQTPNKISMPTQQKLKCAKVEFEGPLKDVD